MSPLPLRAVEDEARLASPPVTVRKHHGESRTTASPDESVAAAAKLGWAGIRGRIDRRDAPDHDGGRAAARGAGHRVGRNALIHVRRGRL